MCGMMLQDPATEEDGLATEQSTSDAEQMDSAIDWSLFSFGHGFRIPRYKPAPESHMKVQTRSLLEVVFINSTPCAGSTHLGKRHPV